MTGLFLVFGAGREQPLRARGSLWHPPTLVPLKPAVWCGELGTHA